MIKRNAQDLGSILKEILHENSMLKSKIAEQRVLRAWKELLGEGVSMPGWISLGILYWGENEVCVLWCGICGMSSWNTELCVVVEATFWVRLIHDCLNYWFVLSYLLLKLNPMRLLHISDTHNFHRQLDNLPKADVLIHSGDVSMAGTGKEVVDFIEWFGR